MKFSLILVTIISTLQAAVPNVPQSRIVGGYEVNPKFRYQWMVTTTRRKAQWCGGILITNSHVLTAAHCSQDFADNYQVKYHRHNLNLSTSAEGGQVVDVKSKSVHPLYNPAAIKNDVAVWKLATPILAEIGKVELDDGKYADSTGLLVAAIGWGQNFKGGPVADILQQVDLPIVSYEECNKVWSQRGKPISKDFYVCAAGEGGKDVCEGDSGGPLFIEKDGKSIIIGTTSSGVPCANNGIPSIWARTASYKQWILEQTKVL